MNSLQTLQFAVLHHVVRVALVVRDCFHLLAIERCELGDAGSYTAQTNTETTVCTVAVSGGQKSQQPPHTQQNKVLNNHLQSFRTSLRVFSRKWRQ